MPRCLPLTLLLLLAARGSLAPAADTWQMDVVHRKRGLPLRGLVIEQGAEAVQIRCISRRPGSPTVMFLEIVPRAEVYLLVEQPETWHARAVATARGMDLIESSSSRAREYRSLLSVKLMTSDGERWVEGTVSGHNSRLILLNGVPVDAPLSGTLLLLANHDQPGVIGEVGTILGAHGINIANFALGRSSTGAVGVVNIDEPGDQVAGDVLKAIRAVKPVKATWLVRV